MLTPSKSEASGMSHAETILISVLSTAGTIGPIFALASLVPWAMFVVLVARRLFQLGKAS